MVGRRTPTATTLYLSGMELTLTGGQVTGKRYYTTPDGATVAVRSTLLRLFDRVIASLHRRLDRESDTTLARAMHYPTRWDPFFHDVMTLGDVYRFPTQHFGFHQAQLTVAP